MRFISFHKGGNAAILFRTKYCTQATSCSLSGVFTRVPFFSIIEIPSILSSEEFQTCTKLEKVKKALLDKAACIVNICPSVISYYSRTPPLLWEGINKGPPSHSPRPKKGLKGFLMLPSLPPSLPRIWETFLSTSLLPPLYLSSFSFCLPYFPALKSSWDLPFLISGPPMNADLGSWPSSLAQCWVQSVVRSSFQVIILSSRLRK